MAYSWSPVLVLSVWISLVAVAFASPPAQADGPQIGNGYVATFVNTSDVFISGVFSGVSSNSQRAPFPSKLRIFAGDGGEFSLSTSDGLVQLLSAVNATDVTVAIQHAWYAHRVQRHVLIEEITASRDISATAASVSIPLSSAAEPVTNVTNTFWNIVSNFTSFVAVPYGSLAVEVTVTIYQTNAIETQAFFGNVSVCEVSTVAPASVVLQEGEANTTLTLVSAYCTNVPFDRTDDANRSVPLCKCAEAKLIDALEAALLKTLRTSHVSAWNSLMVYRGLQVTPSATKNPHGSDVDATALQRVIDSSLYGLLSSLREDSPYSTSPGGLSTSGYRGHTFWDMETWMFPTLALFYPEVALGSAIAYRLNREEGAMVNAASVVGGATGTAAFPWESAFSGYDVCPWPQGEHSELHVTADVVLAWRLYDYLHRHGNPEQHKKVFLQQAFPLLNKTAEFWLSRCTKDATTGQWHLNGVTPPDEYHFGNDSVYTNAAVKMAVNFTIEIAELLQLETMGAAGYFAELRDLVDNLVILYDAEQDYHPEFLGYNGTSMVKQADVILLPFPMGLPATSKVSSSTTENDLNYYAPRTDPQGPAMTWSMFAVGYLSLGQTATGYQYFTKGYVNNSFPPFYQWFEVAGGTGCPNFLTGAGGFLQSVWAGLLQMRVTGPNQLTILPSANLPSTISCLEARRIAFVGSLVNVTLCSSPSERNDYAVSVAVDQQGPRSITANGIGLLPGAAVTFEIGGSANQSVVIEAIA